MTALLVCGGTAGHIYPALSIASEIKKIKPGSKIYFIGAGRELEKRLIPQEGYELFNIKMSGIRRGFKPGDIVYNIKTVMKTIAAGMESKRLLKRLKPDFVIGTGGYVCYPVLRKASKMNIPAYIHESNSILGLAARMLSPHLDKIFAAYEILKSDVKYPEKIICTGTPIRREFFEYTDNRHESGSSAGQDNKPLVVSFWGSLGSSKMNNMMPGFIKKNLEEKCFHHIHGTGGDKSELCDKLSELGVENTSPPFADIREYISDMPKVLADADLVLCRAGASTLAELAATFKPAILVPSPYVVDNQQLKNAEMLEKAGAALKLEECNCSPDVLYNAVKALLSDGARLSAMKDAQKSLYKENAAEKIVRIILLENELC